MAWSWRCPCRAAPLACFCTSPSCTWRLGDGLAWSILPCQWGVSERWLDRRHPLGQHVSRRRCVHLKTGQHLRCHLFAFDGLELDADGCAHFDPILDFFSFGPGIVCITALWAHRWRRRSHGSVGLGILLAVPLVLARPVVDLSMFWSWWRWGPQPQ